MESIHSHNGFTLVELMVVLAIIGIITAITITSQSSFNKTLILSNTAYDIALTIRSAETFGISSRASGGIANAGYGVHFSKGTTNSFIIFPDISPIGSLGSLNCPSTSSTGTPDCKPGDGVYTADADKPVQNYTLNNGITISDFCAGSSCEIANGGTLKTLDIVFARPNPKALISADGSYSASLTTACLTIASPSGTYRYVKVESSGAITANAPSCP